MLVIVWLLIERVARVVACCDHFHSYVKLSLLWLVEFANCNIFWPCVCVSSAFDVLMFISFSCLCFSTALYSNCFAFNTILHLQRRKICSANG